MRKQAITRSCSVVLRVLMIVSILANLNACAHAGRNNPPPIPQFESVALVNQGVSSELNARFGHIRENSTKGVDTLTGVETGAAIAIENSLFCGPYVLLCALYTVPAAAMIGAMTTGNLNRTERTHGEPPEKELLVLDSLFGEIAQQRTINLEIEDSLMQKIPRERLEEVSAATALLQFRLYDVRFSRASGSKYALTLKTVMLFKWNRDTRQPSSTHRVYEHTSQELPLESWVEDQGMTLNQAFDKCIAGLSQKMAGDIKFHRP